MPIHVLHINAGNLYGGVETMLVTLARERGQCPGMMPHFAVGFEGRFSEALTEAGTPPFLLGNVRLRYPWQVFRARHRLRALLKQKHFDAVLCHMSWTLSIFGPVIRRAKVPLVFWMHAPASKESSLDRRIRRIRPDLVIANSKFTADSLPELFTHPPAHVVIHPAVSELRVQLIPAERAQLRAEFQASPDDAVIIQVSRMEEWKGHALHLNALALLGDVPNWKCWIVGGGQRPAEMDYLRGLKILAQELGLEGRVQFLGQRSDVALLLQAADIFCQPNTEAEPFGIVLVEALLSRLPVVTTALAGTGEIINDTCGRLVPPDDPVALAETLRELIESRTLREGLGQLGPSRARELSSPAANLSQLEQTLRTLLSKKSGLQI
jgi:glycosyltransferase involved in cell wall biosynthesis